MGDAKIRHGYYMQFHYDELGFGELELHNDSIIALSYAARTGSRDNRGMLVHAIPAGIWTGRTLPVKTNGEIGIGWWKYRLWTPAGVWSRYLVHEDTGMPGTDGCIGIQSQDGKELFDDLTAIHKMQKIVPIYINVPVPKEGYVIAGENKNESDGAVSVESGAGV